MELGNQESRQQIGSNMAFWLFKSEPDAWSWEKQKEAGAKGTEWTGVRNYLARNN
ncbi:EVE domain-containing protein, partial [Escherichia coli]|uniref:EVE domain-containing protein n=1 Tax=Escherichia coli TaxID=562 RepID=UPI0034D163AD